MTSLAITIRPQINHRKFLIEMDVEKFEKLAALLGFFNSEFLKSIDQAEKNWKEGKVKKIKSLKELRK